MKLRQAPGTREIIAADASDDSRGTGKGTRAIGDPCPGGRLDNSAVRYTGGGVGLGPRRIALQQRRISRCASRISRPGN